MLNMTSDTQMAYERSPIPDTRRYSEPRGGDYGAPTRPRHAPAAAEPNNVLGVFGLSIRTRERDLEDEFNRCGVVEKVVIVYDQRVSCMPRMLQPLELG